MDTIFLVYFSCLLLSTFYLLNVLVKNIHAFDNLSIFNAFSKNSETSVYKNKLNSYDKSYKMTSIDKLFDCLLEEIFKNLPRGDRLICKRVNKRWYKLLMESFIFRDDGHIYIKTSEIRAGRAPMTVLMKAKTPYKIYTIQDDTEGKGNNDLIQLLKCVGESIEELTYTGSGNYCDILTAVPSIKSLALPNSFLSSVNWNFSTIKENNPNVTFQHLERIQLGRVGGLVMSNAVKFIDNIKKCIPKKCQIILADATLDSEHEIESICELMNKVMKIKTISIDVKFKSQAETMQLLEVNNINCDRFLLGCKSKHRPFSLLETLQSKHENLKGIILMCHEFSQPDAVTDLLNLTTLHLSNIKTSFSSLKFLEKMSNLKDLTLMFDGDACGFGNKTFDMPNLKILYLSVDTLCKSCLNGLSNSFENLEDFSLLIDKLNWNKLKALTHKWANNLRSLHICYMSKCKQETIKEMSNVYPNLEKLDITITEDEIPEVPLSEMVRAAVPAFQKLNRFKFYYDSPFGCNEDVKDKEFWTITKYLEHIGLPIANIMTSYHDFTGEGIDLIIDQQKKLSQMILD